MDDNRFYNKAVETLDRDDLDALIDERVSYTISYAVKHSPFYRDWFHAHHIDPGDVRTHEDLLSLPIISGRTVRENQPPHTPEFRFLSAPLGDIFTIHETSGTSGVPKSFFLTYEEWLRYAEKYARIFISQGFHAGDRVVVCTT
ncbi:MAG: coenzyme F390 synthetase, partial [Methanomicrobiales archaeon]